MTIRALALLAVILGAGCASNTEFSYGTPIQAKHYVSVAELLGNASWFDGEPVSVVGVAQFRRGRGQSSGIYMSVADKQNSSDAYIYFDLPDDFSQQWDAALELDGSWIVVHGVFRMDERHSLPTPDENVGQGNELGMVIICGGDHCGSPGHIEVHFIGDW